MVSTVARWFRRTARPLPWRNDETSPWGVLLSEVMAQQTPVARVAPMWLEWIERWPTATHLADASPADVVRAWGRLGYPRRALNLLAQPQHAALSAKLLWQAADAMWRAAGDTATDYNHYTKRLILSGIYSATLLHWTQDDSEDFAATRRFIDRRIDGVMRFEKAKAKLTGMAGKLPDPARFLGRLRYPAV